VGTRVSKYSSFTLDGSPVLSYSAPEPKWIIFPNALAIAYQIKEHAAIPVEQVRRSSQSPVRPRGCGMHDHIETVFARYSRTACSFSRSSSAEEGARHLICAGKLLRQISSNEARTAGDEYAHYAGVRKENFLCPTKLYTTINAVRRAPAI
jgi:hypothetical protein